MSEVQRYRKLIGEHPNSRWAYVVHEADFDAVQSKNVELSEAHRVAQKQLGDLWKELDAQRLRADTAEAERQEPKTSQVPVLRAMAANYRNGHSWDFLDGEAVSKAADEITVLQSTIAQLQARVQELESGRGEPVAYLCNAEGARWLQYHPELHKPWKPEDVAITPLYTAPPAPVAVVLPERMQLPEGDIRPSPTTRQQSGTPALTPPPR